MATRYDIFLSYRRSDGKDIARAIKETLEHRGFRVFLDMDELQDGVFDKRILDAIQSAPIYLILLTSHCLERCDKPTDWVRQEIDYALSHHKQIIPINPDKQFTGFPDYTPEHIRRGLSQHQYSAIDTGQLYQVSMQQLVSRRLEPVFRRRRARLGMWIAIAFAMLSLVIWGILTYHQAHQPKIDYLRGCYYNQLGEPTYNRDSALYFLNKAAERGYAPAQRDLGQLYQFSIDIPNHEAWSFYWLKKAYLNSDTLAIAMLGYNYEYGIGMQADIAEAITLYREGVEQHDPYAYYLLGTCLCEGKGVDQDYVMGMHLISEAASRNDAWARLRMLDEGRWIFSPSYDSIPDRLLQLKAICLSDTMTTLYLSYTNKRHLGAWIQIDPQTYLFAPQTRQHYPLLQADGCAIAPDTTNVAWGTTQQFALSFAAVPDSVYRIDWLESDTTGWRIYNISLR